MENNREPGMDKEQVLAQLWSLRAGLSAISVDRAKVAAYDKTITVLNNRYQNVEASVKRKEGDIQRIRTTKLSREIEKLNDWKQRVSVSKEDIVKSTSALNAFRASKASRGFINIILLLLIPVMWAALIAIFVSCLKGGGVVFALFLAFAGGCGCLFATSQLIVKVAARSTDAATKLSGLSKRLQNEQCILTKAEQGVAKSQEQINKYRGVIEKLEREIAEEFPKVPEKRQAYADEKKQEMEKKNALIERNDQTFKLLYSAYAPLLDIRDWKHLDLVITTIETGRADSMKEALQVVDRRVQTNEIVDAIRTANDAICQAIEVNAARVAMLVAQGFTKLSQQMNTMSQQMNAIGRQVERLSDQVAETGQRQIQMQQNLQLSNQELMGALRAKSDESSDQLMEDVHYMRRLAENAEIRRRNNA